MRRGAAVLLVAAAASSAAAAQDRPPLDDLGALAPHLAACWRPPAFAGKRTEITVRFALRRDGSLLGEPRIVYITAGLPTEERDRYGASVRDLFGRCTPVPLSPNLGAAIAGRPYSLRLVQEN